MSARDVMEAALRNDVAECEKRLQKAKPAIVIGPGKMVRKGDTFMYEVAERDLAHSQARLEQWLVEQELKG